MALTGATHDDYYDEGTQSVKSPDQSRDLNPRAIGDEESDGRALEAPSTVPWNGVRSKAAVVLLVALAVIFRNFLAALALHAAGSDIHSHILLVPVISAYLIYLRRKELPRNLESSYAWAIVPFLLGLAGLSVWRYGDLVKWHLSGNDSLSVMALSFYCLLVAIGFMTLGRKWMAACAFPVAFLIFIVPLPDGVVDSLETASKLASTEAADLLFRMTGTPVLRDGTVFQLPGMVVEVAQECSGIRSSLVLFVTGLLAAHLLLRSTWRRILLVALVIPLGIVRNGIRILVISLLCVHVGPQMIHSDIHRRGGPLFFVLSLIPLFGLLLWLRRGERLQSIPKSETQPPEKPH